ncbi:MAG TPA: purine-nucleoside phosphorylase [Planctomycetota bacterium]|nr:purine-nucleoside phosphorylase [Planctomycetota bacterium]
MPDDLKTRINQAVTAIAAPFAPEVGIILGTGLGAVAASIEKTATIPYEKIPHFARSTVASHKGDLLLGHLEGRRVVAMEGRFHAYEGYSMEQITFPVRVMRALGAKALVVSNACGGLNPAFGKGDLMLIDDHINLMGANPLVGPNDDSLGPRFPDMFRPYDATFLKLAWDIAVELRLPTHAGVYAALTGPCLETRAEYKYLRTIGADVVGMSTVPEVIVGVHAGLRILGISIITDLCTPEALGPVKLEEILATAREAEPKLATLLRQFLRRVEL